MHILLVYPEMPDTFWTMRHFNIAVGKRSTYPPLGLMTVAAMFPETWTKTLVDLNIEKLEDTHLQAADFVFISAMNVQLESVYEIISLCKKSGKKIVAGGPLFTHEHERFRDIDHFILNEAEITFPMFLADLETGNLKRIYQTTEFANVEETPVPDYSLVDVDNYLYSIIQYSRGCPYLCDFCDVTALFGRKPRTKTPQQIIAELEVIVAKSVNTVILFADDNLIGNKKHLKKELLPALIAWRRKYGYPIYFATQLTINLADDDELMSLMLQAGFRHIFIGIETPEEEGLAITRKNQNLRRNVLANIKKLHRAGFIISGGFIVGLDSDKESIFEIQENFIQQSGIPLPIVNILKAPPGTELFERISREGRLTKEFTFLEDDTNMEILMGNIALYKGFHQLVAGIYTPKKSFERMKEFLSDYNYPNTGEKLGRPKYSFTELRKMAAFMFKMAFVYEEKKYFWKLFYWTWKNKPRLLEKAIITSLMIRQMNMVYKGMQSRLESKIRVAMEDPKNRAFLGKNIPEVLS